MSNRLTNAGFLDLTTGWSASTQLTPSVDEAVRGGPGRAVLVGAGTTTAANQTQFLRTAAAQRPAITPGQIVEAHLFFFASHAATVTLDWMDAGGNLLSSATMVQRPALLTQHGTGLLGLSETFVRAYVRATAPANTASARVSVAVTPAASGSAVTLALLKPFIDVVASLTGEPVRWDPGIHSTTDLNLPVWPSILRPFQAAPVTEPIPNRREFQTAEGIPSSRRLYAVPRRRLKGRLRCDAVQRASLDAFYEANHAAFWVVDPETEQLCRARWAADGAPRVAEVRGPTMMVEVGLHLEVA